MPIKISFLFYLFATLFLIQCNIPQQKENNTNNVSVVDSLKIAIDTSLQSEITCPECGFKKAQTMPTEVCLISYVCEKCKSVINPKKGDCCVFCSYGTHKCPSKEN